MLEKLVEMLKISQSSEVATCIVHPWDENQRIVLRVLPRQVIYQPAAQTRKLN